MCLFSGNLIKYINIIFVNYHVLIMFIFNAAILDISTIISDAAENLRTQYTSNKFFNAEDSWCQYQPKHYTTLAIVHKRNASSSMPEPVTSVTMKLAVAGSVASALVSSKIAGRTIKQSSKETKSLSDIFAPFNQNPGIILIEGAPGVGKTVLAKEIAFEWANKKLLSSKELLFLVFLREFNANNITSIEGFVQHIIKSNGKIASCLERYLYKTKGKSLVIVFDGYDEISEEDRKKSFIVDIVLRRVFPKCCLVITSHPTASSLLDDYADCRVEIVGFSEEDRLDYIQTALQGKCDHVKALQQYLQSNPTINALCYTPINMTILLCLTEDGIDNLPKTQSDVYEKFIGMTIKRFIEKTDEQNCIKNVVNNTMLPFPHNEVFKELVQLAFKGLQTEKKIFTLEEIQSSCPNLTATSISMNGLGLLKAVPFFNRQTCTEDVTFRFLHFSIQEYMAAYCIAKLSDQKQIKLLQKTFWEHRFYNTWIMYVGITGGTSFALKHFLSGNAIKLHTKLSSTFSICGKMLKNKIKCLHLIQCLEESKNVDVAALLRSFLQDQEIDLSNQTLLPSDLNTLGFFLCRSTTKQWEKIILSNCNIGVTGCDVLCDRFLDKETQNVVRVNRVDFSYNQLNFSCLARLFNLFKSWHTSEVIITDDALLNDTAHSILYTKIEETFMGSCFNDTLNLLLLGTFLYAKMMAEIKILNILSNISDLKSIYLMCSKWDPDGTEAQEWYIALKQQSIKNLHVVGINTSKSFIAALASILSCNHNPFSLFIYDPFLSNSIATVIVDTLSSNENTSEGLLRLVISSGRIAGVLTTHCNQLSFLELFNLGVCIKYFDHFQIPPWKQCLQTCTNFHINTFVLYSLIEHIAYNTSCKCPLQVVFREDNIVFASKVDMEEINIIMNSNYNLSIYLCKCDLMLMQYSYIASHCTALCIIKSNLGDALIELLCTRLFDKRCILQELFIQDSSNVSVIKLDVLMNSQCHYTSVLLVINGMMIGHNPTVKQIALAFQLEPSILVWKVLNCQVTADVFYQLTSWLKTIPNHWNELDFEGCNITDVECEIFYEIFKCGGCPLSVKTLAIPVDQLPISIISKLLEIVIIWKVQYLILHNASTVFHKNLSKRLVSLTGICDKVHLFIASKICKLWFFYNTDLWYETIMLNSRFTELYLTNCNIPVMKVNMILHYLNKKCNRLLRIFIISSSLSEAVIINLFRNYRNTRMELSVCVNTDITDDGAISKLLSIKHIPYLSLKFVLLSAKSFYSFNITQQQLELVHQTTYSQYSCTKCLLTEEENSVNQKELFAAQRYKELEVVHLVGKEFQVLHASLIVGLLNNITTLRTFRVDNYNITDGATNTIEAILCCNKKLEEVHLHQNTLAMNNAKKIMKTLHCLSSIKVLHFTNNYVTDDVVDSIVSLVSNNIYLQIVDFSKCGLTTTSTLKIFNALCKHSSLKVLQMENCSIDNTVAEVLAGILHSNQQLEKLDLSGSNLQAVGCIAICRALQHVSMLTKLSLSNNNINDEVASELVTFLCLETQLNELYLDENCLNARSIHKISVALKNTSTLKSFYIGNNSISNEAVDDIADILSHNTHLQELELQISSLSANDSKRISNALQHTSMLLKLIIMNSNITSESAESLATVLSHNTQLQEITLDGNFLQKTGVKTIANYLQNTLTLVKFSIQDNHCTEDAAHDIAHVVSHNTGLQELNLQGNDLQTTGALVIIKALQKLTSLIKLNIANNGICDAASNDLIAMLLNNIQLQYFCFEGNQFTAKGSAVIQDYYVRKRYTHYI